MRTVVSQKNIIYKRANITNSESTLQSLLLTVLDKTSHTGKAEQRKETVNESDNSTRLINKNTVSNEILFGQLIFFEAGKSQVLITVDESAEFFKIDALTTEQISKAGKKTTEEAEQIRREFINSILYFGIFENHVMLIQSQALKSRDFEAHVNWLLGTRTSTLGNTNTLLLLDTPTQETIEKLEKSPAKTIKIGTPVESKEEQASIGIIDSTAKGIKYVPIGMGANLLAAALGENWLETANLTDALDDANLQVTLQITYLRKTTTNGQKMLDNIAAALRHADEADVEIELSKGGKIKGADLKLSGKIGVKTINGLVDEADLYHQMHVWLMERIVDKSIDFRNAASSGKG